jgi:hypothetical protein
MQPGNPSPVLAPMSLSLLCIGAKPGKDFQAGHFVWQEDGPVSNLCHPFKYVDGSFEPSVLSPK